MSCEWLPASRTRPSPMTTILSALRMVESRCATMKVVRFCAARSSSRAACTMRSLSESRADVASSRMRMDGRLRIARAMAMRCFCPPESWLPPWPTSVS
mmetsp:Transcript_25962/g.76096  ORF Transcript_25962/g.76096 Transcript_25962/m.76096 type:complete len:99 (+) Transcript_25962:119-415(+)